MHTDPPFREKVRSGGQKVVVAGAAFGCGSSREEAVRALKGLGVRAVIAKSFAFIYGRNQPSLGLLGFVIEDDAFYEAAADGEAIEINVPSRRVFVGQNRAEFEFCMSAIEFQLTAHQGISPAYQKWGKAIWEKMTERPRGAEGVQNGGSDISAVVNDAQLARGLGTEKRDTRLEW